MTKRRVGVKKLPKGDAIEIAATAMARLRDLQDRLVDLTVRPAQGRDAALLDESARLLRLTRHDTSILLGAAVSSVAEDMRSGIAQALAPMQARRRSPSRTPRN